VGLDEGNQEEVHGDGEEDENTQEEGREHGGTVGEDPGWARVEVHPSSEDSWDLQRTSDPARPSCRARRGEHVHHVRRSRNLVHP